MKEAIAQERYTAHQARKARVLRSILAKRHSTRVFSAKPLSYDIIREIIMDTESCPSSCDRRGVCVYPTTTRDEKDLLGGILVGGVGWIHRAPAILMLFADKSAYVAGDENKFMPYLDAGVMVQQIYLSCAAVGLKCCFCNPNIREINRKHFDDVFRAHNHIFCGVMAVGWEE